MKSKKEVLKLVKNIARRDRGIPDRRLMHPRREWSIGLLVWLAVTVFGGIYAWYTFTLYSDIGTETAAVEVEQLRYNRADALDAIDKYKVKRVLYENMLLSQPVSHEEGLSDLFEEEALEDVNDEVREEPSSQPDLLEGPEG